MAWSQAAREAAAAARAAKGIGQHPAHSRAVFRLPKARTAGAIASRQGSGLSVLRILAGMALGGVGAAVTRIGRRR